jgi:hypothetical protein
MWQSHFLRRRSGAPASAANQKNENTQPEAYSQEMRRTPVRRYAAVLKNL